MELLTKKLHPNLLLLLVVVWLFTRELNAEAPLPPQKQSPNNNGQGEIRRPPLRDQPPLHPHPQQRPMVWNPSQVNNYLRQAGQVFGSVQSFVNGVLGVIPQIPRPQSPSNNLQSVMNNFLQTNGLAQSSFSNEGGHAPPKPSYGVPPQQAYGVPPPQQHPPPGGQGWAGGDPNPPHGGHGHLHDSGKYSSWRNIGLSFGRLLELKGRSTASALSTLTGVLAGITQAKAQGLQGFAHPPPPSHGSNINQIHHQGVGQDQLAPSYYGQVGGGGGHTQTPQIILNNYDHNVGESDGGLPPHREQNEGWREGTHSHNPANNGGGGGIWEVVKHYRDLPSPFRN